jgi:hypothetical protein
MSSTIKTKAAHWHATAFQNQRTAMQLIFSETDLSAVAPGDISQDIKTI